MTPLPPIPPLPPGGPPRPPGEPPDLPQPSLEQLRTARDVVRALAQAEPDDARGSMLMLVALELGARVRDYEAELVERERRRQWALQKRATLRWGRR